MHERLRTTPFLVMLSGWFACLATALVWVATDPHVITPPPEPLAGAPCPGDLDGDLVVDFEDLLIVLSEWGPCTVCPPALTNCNGICVDLMNDLNNCGACGNVCPPVSSCVHGFCTGP